MAIEKRFIHFKKFSDFNSKKLSANEANTQYTVGVSGEIQDGSPDVLYQSYVWIKDTRQQWTHGTLYDCSGGGNNIYRFTLSDSGSDTLSEEEFNKMAEADIIIETTFGLVSEFKFLYDGEGVISFVSLTNNFTINVSIYNYEYNTIITENFIPLVTEETVSEWGFTKNTGTYSKPSTGIPKSDLESAIQTSLGKADTALQSYTEKYTGTITGVSANGTSVATSGVANIPAASTSKYGVTKLSSATNSTSTTLAATASAVKSAYDLANGRQEKLVSGTNIKTINNTSILGSGNIAIDANIQAVDTSETLDEVNTNTYVKYVAQTLTDEQKAQVRENIGVSDTNGNNNYLAWDSEYFEMGNAYYMAPNKKYICTVPLTYLILREGLAGDTWHNNVTDLYNEYTVVFECNDTQIETPNSWIWANGSVPTLENGVRYELSISLMYINNQYLTHAVLVPFKSV